MAEGEISALPRQPAWGFAADLLGKIKEIAAAMPTSPSAQLVNMLIGNKAQMADDAAYGFPPTRGSGETLGPKPEYASDVADLIPWTVAANAGRKVAGALARRVGETPWQIAGSPAAQAGALRIGGDRSLMYSHGLSNGLEGPGDEMLKELLHPSLAVTGEGSHNNTFASDFGQLIPRLNAFDPAYSTSALFNRDAYIARTSEFPGGKTPNAYRRVQASTLIPPPKSEGLNWQYWNYDPAAANSHDAAIIASPSFRSFKEFEQSPRGAGVLGKDYNEVNAWSKDWTQQFNDWSGSRYAAVPDTIDWTHKLSALRTAAANGDKEAMALIQSARRAPSEYGELKVIGRVPITGDRWAGAILRPGEHSQFAEQLADRGIPSTVVDKWDYAQIHKVASAMQDMAGPVKERSLRVRAGWAPGQDVPPPAMRIEGQPVRSTGGAEAAGFDPTWAKQFESKEAAMKAAGEKVAAKSPYTGDIEKDYMAGLYTPDEAHAQLAKRADSFGLTDKELWLFNHLSEYTTGIKNSSAASLLHASP